MLDPVSRAFANAIDDEPVTEEEERAVAEAHKGFEGNAGIDQVVAELAFTMEARRARRT
jgi:hypothetical protein